MTGAEKDASRVPKGAHRLPAQGDSKAAKSRKKRKREAGRRLEEESRFATRERV